MKPEDYLYSRAVSLPCHLPQIHIWEPPFPTASLLERLCCVKTVDAIKSIEYQMSGIVWIKGETDKGECWQARLLFQNEEAAQKFAALFGKKKPPRFLAPPDAWMIFPVRDGKDEDLYIVEGGIKTASFDQNTEGKFSILGVAGCWMVINNGEGRYVIPDILCKRIEQKKRLWLVMDGDFRTNKDVFDAIVSFVFTVWAKDLNKEIYILCWDKEKGKGIDDFLASFPEEERKAVIFSEKLVERKPVLEVIRNENSKRSSESILSTLKKVAKSLPELEGISHELEERIRKAFPGVRGHLKKILSFQEVLDDEEQPKPPAGFLQINHQLFYIKTERGIHCVRLGKKNKWIIGEPICAPFDKMRFLEEVYSGNKSVEIGFHGGKVIVPIGSYKDHIYIFRPIDFKEFVSNAYQSKSFPTEKIVDRVGFLGDAFIYPGCSEQMKEGIRCHGMSLDKIKPIAIEEAKPLVRKALTTKSVLSIALSFLAGSLFVRKLERASCLYLYGMTGGGKTIVLDIIRRSYGDFKDRLVYKKREEDYPMISAALWSFLMRTWQDVCIPLDETSIVCLNRLLIESGTGKRANLARESDEVRANIIAACDINPVKDIEENSLYRRTLVFNMEEAPESWGLSWNELDFLSKNTAGWYFFWLVKEAEKFMKMEIPNHENLAVQTCLVGLELWSKILDCDALYGELGPYILETYNSYMDSHPVVQVKSGIKSKAEKILDGLVEWIYERKDNFSREYGLGALIGSKYSSYGMLKLDRDCIQLWINTVGWKHATYKIGMSRPTIVKILNDQNLLGEERRRLTSGKGDSIHHYIKLDLNLFSRGMINDLFPGKE